MKSFSRTDRLAAQIQRELAWLLKREVKNPLLHEVTIQEVRLSRDLSHAKVYFTLLNPDESEALIVQLERVTGFLKKRLGQLIKIRNVPQLRFVYDHSLEEGNRLFDLIERANQRHSDG